MRRDYLLFDNLQSVKTISATKHDGSKEFMSDSTVFAVDFDKLKDEYWNEISAENPQMEQHFRPKSWDALIPTETGIIFAEFKSGNFEPEDIYKKIYDSLLIFEDLTSRSISWTRKHCVFILVCRDRLRYSPSLYQMMDYADKYAGKDKKKTKLFFSKLFGYKDYCFRDVRTMTKYEFDKYLAKRSAGCDVRSIVNDRLRSIIGDVEQQQFNNRRTINQ